MKRWSPNSFLRCERRVERAPFFACCMHGYHNPMTDGRYMAFGPYDCMQEDGFPFHEVCGNVVGTSLLGQVRL